MGHDHDGGEIFRRYGSVDEAFNQQPWQNIGTLGTKGTIAEYPVHDEPEVRGWSLPDRVLLGAALSKCPAAVIGNLMAAGQRPASSWPAST